MSKSKVVPLRIPEHLDEFAAVSAREEHTDKATALRQWLYKGAALYALRLVSEGRVSIGYAAQQLDMSIWELHGLAATYGIELGATPEQVRASRELVEQLLANTPPRSQPPSL